MNRNEAAAAVRPYQVCARCIMDTSDPQIRFDSEGICSHCHNYDARVARETFPPALRQARLEALLDRIREEGKGQRYDCIVGVSGGVDSSYVALKVKDAGLRPLAVHFDNGWNSDISVENIKNVLNATGIDLHTYVVDWEEFRDIQMAFIKASVPNCELPTDHGIFATLCQTAQKFGIKYIISGSNLATEGVLPRAWVHSFYDSRNLKAIQRRFGSVRLKSFPLLSLARFAYLVFVKGVRVVNILNYLDYRREDAILELESRTGWKNYGGKHHESVYTRFFQEYYLPVKFGFDKRRAHLSTLILSGQMNRDEALRTMAQPAYSPEMQQVDRGFFMKKFKVSEAKLDELLAVAPRSHLDYPNLEFLLGGMPRVFTYFKKRALVQ